MRIFITLFGIIAFVLSSIAQSDVCEAYTDWNSETVYQRTLGGEQIYVVFEGVLYRLADPVWYSQGNQPDESLRWEEFSSCGIEYDWCQNAIEWDSYTEYNRIEGGQQILVTWKGELYELAIDEWWSKNHPPDKPEYEQYWTHLQNCYAYTEPQCGDYEVWESDVVYSKDAEVFYQGVIYLMKLWWSRNHKPADSPSYWKAIGECPVNDDICTQLLWDFNHVSGTILNDSSNLIFADFQGGVPQIIESSSALFFDGQDDLLSFNSLLQDFSEQAVDDATVTFWVSIESKIGMQTLFHAWDSEGNRNIRVDFLRDEEEPESFIFTFLESTQAFEFPVDELSFDFSSGDNQWHQIALSWNMEQRILDVYVDAVKIGDAMDVGNGNWNPEFDEIVFGAEAENYLASDGVADHFFHGVLDNLRFCGMSLTEEEVIDQYQRELSQFSTEVLPIELLFFNPECGQENGVDILWSTSSEENNDCFTIYRSLDGKNWESIAEIEGAGNSTSVKEYKFHDVEPTAHDTYYKLAQTDFDGTSEEFEIVAIYCKYNHKEITIFPNPATDYIMLTFINEHHVEAPLPVMIYDARGVLVHKQEFFADPDYNEWRIDLPSQLKNGNYYMQVKLGDDYFYTQPFIINK